MKKILLLALLAIVSVSAFARKSYITLNGHIYSRSNFNIIMTGDVPTDIPHLTYNQNDHTYKIDNYTNGYYYSTGEILSILSEYGFDVVFMEVIPEGSETRVQYLLSKEIPSNSTGKDGDVNKDGRVNVSDVTTLVNIILGIVRDNPNLLEQSR